MAIPLAAIVGLATLGAGIYQSVQGAKEKRREEARKLDYLKNRPTLGASPYAKMRLAETRARLNAPTAGVVGAGQRIQQEAANTRAFAQKNAGSGAQALALGAATDANATGANMELAQLQDGQNERAVAQYGAAVDGMERDRMQVFDSQLGKYGDSINDAIGKGMAAAANQGQGMALAMTGLNSAANAMGGATTTKTPEVGSVDFMLRTGQYNNGGNMPSLSQNAMTTTRVSPLMSPTIQGMPPPPGWYKGYASTQ